MGKYEPLARHLKGFGGDIWDTTFEEIEKILEAKLPDSARKHRAWWSNSYRGNHSQAQAWVASDWITRNIEPAKGKVTFERRGRSNRRNCTRRREELWQVAESLSGIKDHDELEAAVLKAFIRQKEALYIASLGGTMPDAEAPPRRRFD